MTGTEIVEFSSLYANAFAALNREWLEEFFHVEPVDLEVLSDPQSHIIDPGGAILFARQDNEIVATVAVRNHGRGLFELTKMAVTARCQGAGIGRTILLAAIDRFHELGGRELYLESHSSLKSALHLYEVSGFVHTPRAEPSEYARADVFMVYKPD